MSSGVREGSGREAAGSGPVRVVVNALHARTGGGITYLRNVLPFLAAEPGFEVHLVLHADQRELTPPPRGVRVHVVHFRDGFVRRLVWEQTALPLLARRIGARVTFSPANFGPLVAPGPVVMLRNTIEVGEVEQRWSKRLYWRALGWMTVLSLLRCRRAIAVSEYARRSLACRLPDRVRRRVVVVPHGVDPVFAPPGAGEAREDFLLTVADLYVQKNLHRLILAVDELSRRFPDLELRIAGRAVDEGYAAELRALVAARGLGNRVHFLGHVETEDLAVLYRRCRAFVFPSLAETFGHPLVEAMASGAPIVSADAAAMPEVVGDAALLVDARDAGAIAGAIARVLEEKALAAELSARALARVRRFDWAETARRTARILDEVARGGP